MIKLLQSEQVQEIFMHLIPVLVIVSLGWETDGSGRPLLPTPACTEHRSIDPQVFAPGIFFSTDGKESRHQLAAKFNSVRSVDVQLGCHRRLGSPLLPSPSPSLLPPKAPWLIMREGMQVLLGLRGVSINALQINKRVIRCTASMCACVHVFFAWVQVYACPRVLKRPLTFSVMERTEREKGCEKTVADCGVEDP